MEVIHVAGARARRPRSRLENTTSSPVGDADRRTRDRAGRPTFATYAAWIAGRGRAGIGLAGPGDRLERRARLDGRAADVYALRSGRGLSAGVLRRASSATSSASTGSIARSSSSADSACRPRALVFALFAGLGALQFLAIAVIDRHLDRAFDALALRSATAVVLAELLMPRLFPWHFGHTQIAFTPFVQVAGIGGAMAVSFLHVLAGGGRGARGGVPRTAAGLPGPGGRLRASRSSTAWR